MARTDSYNRPPKRGHNFRRDAILHFQPRHGGGRRRPRRRSLPYRRDDGAGAFARERKVATPSPANRGRQPRRDAILDGEAGRVRGGRGRPARPRLYNTDDGRRDHLYMVAARKDSARDRQHDRFDALRRGQGRPSGRQRLSCRSSLDARSSNERAALAFKTSLELKDEGGRASAFLPQVGFVAFRAGIG